MLKFVFIATSGFTVGGLCYDIYNRKKFMDEFLPNQELDGKKILEGTINIPVESDEYPLSRIDTNIKNCAKYYDFMTLRNKFISNLFYDPYIKYWITLKTDYFNCPDIKMDNYKLQIDNDCLIHYTHKKIYIIDDCRILVEKYIPNNSKITIFASTDNETRKYLVKFIGPKKYVISDIAYTYYGISTNRTLLLVTGLAISFICLLKNKLLTMAIINDNHQ